MLGNSLLPTQSEFGTITFCIFQQLSFLLFHDCKKQQCIVKGIKMILF